MADATSKRFRGEATFNHLSYNLRVGHSQLRGKFAKPPPLLLG